MANTFGLPALPAGVLGLKGISWQRWKAKCIGQDLLSILDGLPSLYLLLLLRVPALVSAFPTGRSSPSPRPPFGIPRPSSAMNYPLSNVSQPMDLIKSFVFSSSLG